MKNRAYEVAINPTYDEYQRELASMVYNFDKRTGSGARATIKAGVNVNEELPQKLQQPMIKISKERKFMQDLKIIFGQQI